MQYGPLGYAVLDRASCAGEFERVGAGEGLKGGECFSEVSMPPMESQVLLGIRLEYCGTYRGVTPGFSYRSYRSSSHTSSILGF